MKERLPVIIKLQSFGIFLVVLGHCIGKNKAESPEVMIWLKTFIYSFHMPLFIFVSGFLFMYTTQDKEINYKEFLFKKAKRLLLPYFVISTLAFFPKNLLSKYATRDISFSFSSYMDGMIYPTENPIKLFWFLPTLFILFIIAPLIKQIIVKNNSYFLIALGAGLICLNLFNPLNIKLFNIKGVIYYLPYFYLGCMASYCKERLKFIYSNQTAIYSFVLLIGLLVWVSNQSMGEFERLFDFITACVGIVFSFSIANLLHNNQSKVNVFKYIDGYSYQIFLISWFPQAFFAILYRLNVYNYGVAVITMLVGGLFIPLLVAKTVENKITKLRVVVGL